MGGVGVGMDVCFGVVSVCVFVGGCGVGGHVEWRLVVEQQTADSDT